MILMMAAGRLMVMEVREGDNARNASERSRERERGREEASAALLES